MKLTSLALQKMILPTCGQVDVFDLILPAFGVRVTPKGTKTFFVMTRLNGKKKLTRVSIGRYPALGLAEARQAARAALELAANGSDPRSKTSAASPTSLAGTERFDTVADEFLDNYARRRLRPATIRQYEYTLNRICAKWHSRPLISLSKRDILHLLEGLEMEGKLALADATYRYLNRFFRWCFERDYIERSPMEGIRWTHHVGSRERFLEPSEISDVWNGIKRLGYPFGPMLQILLLTGQRRDEVAGMRWSEISFDENNPIWEIPSERTKNKKRHLVPLVPDVLKILVACPRESEFVFTTTGRTPVSGFSKTKSRLAEIISKVRSARGDKEDLADWRFHDFRRTFSTHASETLGVEPHIIEATINHMSGTKAGVAGVYNRATYLTGRREALSRWATYVIELARA